MIVGSHYQMLYIGWVCKSRKTIGMILLFQDDFVPVPERFPVFSQKALRPGDPDDVTCRYGFKAPTSIDIRKPDFLVEYRVTFSGHSSDGRSASENCISAAGKYAEKLAETVQEQTKNPHDVEKLKGL